MTKKTNSQIEKEVAELYSKYPYPSTPVNKKSELLEGIIYETVYYLIKDYLEYYKNKKIKILDAGCGTGELALGLASTLGLKATVLGIDRNDRSLKIARERAKKWKINNVEFKHVDLVKDSLPEEKFDLVFSIGVIHHIPEAEKVFKKLVRSTKKGGYLTTGFYNPYGMMRKRLERQLLKILAGVNIEKRMRLAKKLYYRRELTPYEEVWAADTYAHPFQQYYSIEELFSWFKKYNLEYQASEPPLEPFKNIKLLKALIGARIEGDKTSLVKLWQSSISNKYVSRPFEKSTLITLFTQIVWMLIGAVYGRGEFVNLVSRKIK